MDILDSGISLKELFLAALEHPPEARSDFLAEACSGDRNLQREIESLLAVYESYSDALRTPGFELSSASLAAEALETLNQRAGERLGPYRLVDEIGRGGMGAVYLAQRDDGQFEQQVAIKLIKRGMDTDAIVRRFHRERQILADLNHPNIARLLDGGVTPDGRPFFVMEYIKGLPIHEYMATQKRSIEARLELFRSICSAVHYAHQHQVIHRDLKPGNILVTPEGVPKLLDFGVARWLDAEQATSTAGMTPGSFSLMTPECASPEQLRGLPATTASDVYSLGLLLYELLTGRPPFRFASRLPHEVLKTVLENAPAKPSTVVPPEETISGAPRKPARRLCGDLDNIVLMALHHDPAQRYASAEEFAEDIRRHLAGLPVLARQEGLVSRSIKFLNRHRVSAALTIVVFLLCVLLGFSLSALTTGRRGNTSLAVLPLANHSQAPNMEYLADGITDGLIRSLSQIPKLTVPPHNSVFPYKGQTINPQAIGNALGVQVVLTGSVEQGGENLFINIKLSEAQTNQTISRFEYTGKAADLLSIQRQIARDIASLLDLAPELEQPVSIRQQGTEDVEAYRLYLKGQYFFNRREEDFLNKGIEYFRQAIDKDPQYALAYSSLANCYSLLGAYKVVPPDSTFPAAKQAALKAIELEPDLAEAHTSLALLTWLNDWDWAAADREFRRAIELNPNFATAPHWYALYLAEMGRFEEAVASIKQALELDPASVYINADYGRVLFYARRYDESLEQYRKTVEMAPNFSAFYVELSYLYEQLGLFDEWVTVTEKFNRSKPELQEAYLKHDIKTFWRIWLKSDRTYLLWTRFYPSAEMHARLGETNEALAMLEKAYEARDHQMAQLKVNPAFDSLRSEPRFQELLRRMNFP
jgi:serine/threonine protein kinase/Tfp pilus assembly protein PilF